MYGVNQSFPNFEEALANAVVTGDLFDPSRLPNNLSRFLALSDKEAALRLILQEIGYRWPKQMSLPPFYEAAIAAVNAGCVTSADVIECLATEGITINLSQAQRALKTAHELGRIERLAKGRHGCTYAPISQK